PARSRESTSSCRRSWSSNAAPGARIAIRAPRPPPRPHVSTLARTYRQSLALLTDLYEITMAYGYWKEGRREQEAAFNLLFRTLPFQGGFAIACGMEPAMEFLEQFRFTPDDLGYLASLAGADGAPLFEPDFLRYLGDLRFSCDVDIVPEGTAVFPQ